MEKKLKNISYILQVIDSARFMASSLANIVINSSEGIHKIEYKYGHNDEYVKHVNLNINIVTVFLNTQILEII